MRHLRMAAIVSSLPMTMTAFAADGQEPTILDLLYVRTDVGASIVPDLHFKDLPVVAGAFGGFGISGLDVSTETGIA